MKFFVDTADTAAISELRALGLVALTGPSTISHTSRVTSAVVGDPGKLAAPPGVLMSLASHPLTGKGLAQFLKDWEATGQKIV